MFWASKYIGTGHLNGGIAEPEETAIPCQRPIKMSRNSRGNIGSDVFYAVRAEAT
jgi:hypothetical protein